MINEKNYKQCLRYIHNYWDRLTYYHPNDKQSHLGLPHKFISPNRYIFKNDLFYWDTYFVILALVKLGKIRLAKGMVENLSFLFDRFGIIPMRNRYYNLGTSQIPFLTSMCLEVFSADKDKRWLIRHMRTAEKELSSYWLNRKLTEKHIVYKGLSRYCDHYITHLGAEHESGWDMTSRFYDRCLEYLPVDLNSCLYKYEMDLSGLYRLQKKYSKAKYYAVQARKRKGTITRLMWNESKKFYFDYNYIRKAQSKFLSVAGFYPMWANLASKRQAELIRKHTLPLFEHEGGIVNTQPDRLSDELKQHDFPNGWPNQQWIVIKGLLNYGFRQDAERIARKWLDLNNRIFMESGKLWEKYDVVNGEVGISNPDRYPTQSGFGWTNAVFIRLLSEFKSNEF